MIRNSVLLILLLSLSFCAPRKPTFNATEYWMKPPHLTNVTYDGGDGNTIENPIIIKNAGNERNGVAAEYAFIAKTYGEQFKDWKVISQASSTNGGRTIDSIIIQLLVNNKKLTLHFDITEFFGKF